MSNTMEDALLLLADNFKTGGYYMHSVHCLRALCITQKLLPAMEVKVRLQLARLLMDYTYDVEQAKNELKTAHVLVSTLPGSFCLRCEVLSLLSSCHKLLGNEQEQRDFLQAGLGVSKQGAHTSERNDLFQWQVYFHCRLAEVQLTQRDVGGALQWVEAGLQRAYSYKLGPQQVLLLLCRLHLQLQQSNSTPAAQSVLELRESLLQLQHSSNADPAFLLQAKLNFNIMQVLLQLREGQLQDLSTYTEHDKSRLAVFHEMETLLQQLSKFKPPYDWLPYSALSATIHLLAANILKPTGKVKLALLHASTGERFVDALLQEAGTSLSASSTSAQPHRSIMCSASTPLLLKLLLLECKIQLQLLQTNLAGARQDLWRCVKLLSAYPFLSPQMGAAVHVLVSMYAHSTGSFAEAARHCQAALNHAAGEGRNAMAVAACLKVLASIEAHEAGAISSGLDVLDSELDSELGLVETVVVQFTRSVLREQQGNAAEAKALLGKALKLAHRKLCSHHLISTVLNVLAPLQLQDNDVAGGQQMGTSSYTLSRNNCDIPGLLNAFQVIHQTHQLEARDAATMNSDCDYIGRKSQELQRCVQLALEDREQHTALMQWDV